MWSMLYQAVVVLAYPWVRLRLYLRAWREPAYRERSAERFGRLPAGLPRGALWVHAASAGEVAGAAPLVAQLQERFPEVPVLVTTMTPAGASQVRDRLGPKVAHAYAPYDFPWAVARFYGALAPRLLLLIETELWPNLLASARRRGVPTLLLNARLSARSTRRYARFPGIVRPMLRGIERIACQSDAHAGRFIALGAPAERVSTLGNIKFDAGPAPDHATQVAALRDHWDLGHEPVWIAASTHPGEEEMVLAAHRRVRQALPDARLLLVPRHPPRAPQVVALAQRLGFHCVRQSDAVSPRSGAQATVIVGDVMGQLRYLYGLAQVAFVGGSLVAVGGHNPVEPALCGVPVLTGPHHFNFVETFAAFSELGCLGTVSSAEDLAAAVALLLRDPERRDQLGKAGRELLARHAGATERTLEVVADVLRRLPPRAALS
jgi:3-deoxy-D-manno-octulosonic-acid transferase